MSSYPKKSKAFGQWAKLMQEQAVVPDRVDYKKRAVKGGKKPSRQRRKRFRSRKRRTTD